VVDVSSFGTRLASGTCAGRTTAGDPGDRPLLSLAGARPVTEPFPWYHLAGTFGPELAGTLLGTFPVDGFTTVSRPFGEKSYEMSVRRLSPAGPEEAADLCGAWAALLAYVTSGSFADTVAAVVDLPLSGADVEVNLWRYSAGCWLAPHVDKPEKVVTVLCYLNPDWPTDHGGELLLLRSPAPQDVACRVRPLLDTGVILVRSDHSWHAVDPVRDPDGHLERRSLQIVFQCGSRGDAPC
jgi:SM-20-related protein